MNMTSLARNTRCRFDKVLLLDDRSALNHHEHAILEMQELKISVVLETESAADEGDVRK
jgi:hypothetical protein